MIGLILGMLEVGKSLNPHLHKVIISLKPPLMKANNWLDAWYAGGGEEPTPGVNRFSIFHELSYWGELQINHLLDPMHMIKNLGVPI